MSNYPVPFSQLNLAPAKKNEEMACLHLTLGYHVFSMLIKNFVLISKMVIINSYNLHMKNLFDNFFRVHGGPENRKFENH